MIDMKKNWRIVKHTFRGDHRYTLEKRLLGFLWWINPDNIDAYTTGWYETHEQAYDRYIHHTSFITREVVKDV